MTNVRAEPTEADYLALGRIIERAVRETKFLPEGAVEYEWVGTGWRITLRANDASDSSISLTSTNDS